MRIAAGVLAAVLLAGPAFAQPRDVAVSLAQRSQRGSCAVVSTATIVAYDLPAAHRVTYRFVRSDGTASPPATLVLGGPGAVARSVDDRWTPRGTSPWIALEIEGGEAFRTPHAAVTARCATPNIAER